MLCCHEAANLTENDGNASLTEQSGLATHVRASDQMDKWVIAPNGHIVGHKPFDSFFHSRVSESADVDAWLVRVRTGQHSGLDHTRHRGRDIGESHESVDFGNAGEEGGPEMLFLAEAFEEFAEEGSEGVI